MRSIDVRSVLENVNLQISWNPFLPYARVQWKQLHEEFSANLFDVAYSWVTSSSIFSKTLPILLGVYFSQHPHS
jgi:hypothetical protein